MYKIVLEIENLYEELQANKGIMPDSWKPYANALIAVLTIADLFFTGEIKIIITEIIAAIRAAENV